MTIHDARIHEPPTRLTSYQRHIIEYMLSMSFQGRDQLLQQLRSALVRSSCQACPTFVLDIDRSAAPVGDVLTRVPVEAEGFDTDGGPIHVLLHVVNGYLDEVEFFRKDGGEFLDLLPKTDNWSLFL